MKSARTYGLGLSMLFLICLLPGSSSGDDIYIEAESVPPDSPWIFETEKEGYTGEGYLHWVKGSRGDGVLVYEFDIPQAGTYEVWLRGRRDQEGVCEGKPGHYCNDVFTQMNDGRRCKTMVKGSWGRWIWEARTAECHDVSAKEYEMEAGTNTLTVSGRSNGVKLDAIVINLAGTERIMEPPTTSRRSDLKRIKTVNRSVPVAAVFDLRGRAQLGNADVGTGNPGTSLGSGRNGTKVTIIRYRDGSLSRELSR